LLFFLLITLVEDLDLTVSSSRKSIFRSLKGSENPRLNEMTPTKKV